MFSKSVDVVELQIFLNELMLASRFCLKSEGRNKKFKSLEVREASSSHLKRFLQ